MADPASIVGLAAGLISLGIQVCGGITAYLDAVKCRADDIASVNRQAQNFRNVLRAIETALARVDSSHHVSTAVVAECLKSCEAELKGLEDFVSELVGGGTSSQPTLKDKIKTKTRKLAYVFDRPKLEQLEGRLDRVNGIFQTAIQALRLDISSSTIETLGGIESSSRTIASDLLVVRSEVAVLNDPLVKINDKLPNIQGSVDSLSPLIVLKTDSLSTEIHDGTRTIRNDLQEWHSSFQSSSESNQAQLNQIEQLIRTSEQSHCIANIERMLSELSLQGTSRNKQEQQVNSDVLVGRLVAKPSNLRALCDGVASLPKPSETGMEGPSTHLESSTSHTPKKRCFLNCFCRRRRRYQRQYLRWGPIELYDETSSAEEHLPDCEYSQIVTSRRKRSVGFKYTGVTGLLNRAITMAFSMNYGAGGFGIGPSFTYYATVDGNSAPAFRLLELLRSAYWSECEEDDLNGLAELISRKILKLFRERQASPTDMNLNNETILHSVTDVCFYPRTCDLLVMATVFQTLLKCGVPITYDSDGRSPLESVFDKINSSQSKIAESFIPEDYDGLVRSSMYKRVDGLHELLLLKKSQRIAEAWGCGPLSLAILANDLDQTRQILTYHPTTIEERDLQGQTPLHLAVDKPECLQLLLQVQAVTDKLLNSFDSMSWTAVDRALYSSRHICHVQEGMLCDDQCPCTISLQILFNSNCALYNPLNKEHDQPIDKASRRGILKYANELKNRREQLKVLALEHLSLLEIEELGLKNESVLDAYASRVIERLQAHNIAVPASLAVSRGILRSTYVLKYGSIYHRLSNSFEADVFFDLGFRDVDAVDSEGFPPLASVVGHWRDSFSYILWLVEHGTQLFYRLEYTESTRRWRTILGSTSAHWAFKRVGYVLHWIYDRRYIMDSDEKDIISQLNTKVLSIDMKDECCCKCSLSGCSPLIWMLKSMLDNMLDIDSPDLLDRAQMLHWYMSYFSSDMEIKHLQDTVRAITFEALDIQHICCDGGSGCKRIPIYDPEDIREIEEEQTALLETLESLVLEFEDKITGIFEQEVDNRLTALAEFWTGYWYDRMDEVLDDLDGCDLSSEERAGPERIGVEWNDDTSETSSEEEDKDDIRYWYRRVEEIA